MKLKDIYENITRNNEKIKKTNKQTNKKKKKTKKQKKKQSEKYNGPFLLLLNNQRHYLFCQIVFSYRQF